MDRCVAKKKKKQKLKNLRVVCNKLLDFCDRQEADDLFYEQVKNHTIYSAEELAGFTSTMYGIPRQYLP